MARYTRLLCLALCLALAVPSLGARQIEVEPHKVVMQLADLAHLSDVPLPAVTRIIFTENDLKARKFVKSLMESVGLEVREDAMGNIFGRWEGSDPSAGAIVTGSHCDAIPLAGMYDGTVGVLGGIEALNALKKAGFKPKKSLEVMMFTSEEPTRFGLSCVGSRAMAGVLDAETLEEKMDKQGNTFLEAARAAGYEGTSHQDLLDRTLVPKGAISHFVELHIEQGPLLEQEKTNIGVVTAIAAPAALQVQFSGDGGHAGAQLMHLRNDAGLAGAELALKVEELVLAVGTADTVGTTGTFEVLPGAVNSVPREAKLGIDIRDIDGPRRDRIVAGVTATAQAIAARRRVRHTLKVLNQDPPATCDKAIVSAVDRAARELGLSTKHMVSRAYHDSLFMARIAPTGMIFIPCRNGYSHRPDEFASEKDIGNGISVLALTMAELSGGKWPGDEGEL